MRETLICTGKLAEKPYRFPDTGVNIYSYEEMCYYFSQNMICYLHTLPEPGLLHFIRDGLGLEKLYKQLSKLMDPARDQMKFFACLFREGAYFTEDEIRDILDHYRSRKNAPRHMQCRWLGDTFIRNGRSNMAQEYYKAALAEEGVTKEDKGILAHNLGVTQLRLFRFEDARISFLKAYRYGQDENSLFYYYSIIALTESLAAAAEDLKEFDISDLLLEEFESRFARFQEEFANSDEADRMNRMLFLEKHERTEDASEMRKSLIRKMQAGFRKQMDVDEKLLVTNLPVLYNIDEDKNQEE